MDTARRAWLVVGHGSVGSAIARRLADHQEAVLVYDPSPRVPVTAGRRLQALTRQDGPIDFIVSCVPPGIAAQVPPLVAPMIHEGSVFLDWNTISPDAKLAISRAAPCEVLDVALLDSLDADGSTPRLAISGPGAEGRRALLEGLGFHVDVAGPAAGDAALLKYARSIFMKSLEGLVLEYVALAHTIDRQGLVAASLANNLGDQFTRFFGLLVSTNRVHAGRRAGELADAVKVFEERGSSVEVARAVVGVLERAAQAWKQPGAPAPNGDLDALVAYLAEKL